MWHLIIMAFYGAVISGFFGIAWLLCACYEYYLEKRRIKCLAKRRITIMQDFS